MRIPEGYPLKLNAIKIEDKKLKLYFDGLVLLFNEEEIEKIEWIIKKYKENKGLE